ncbi:MAG: sigma-70 family RNA polymerase sigma factor [Vicinamibacterales bacterium]
MTKRRDSHLSDGPRRPAADYEALVRAAATGEPQAVERLLVRAQEVAFRFSLLVCGNAHDAEDVMQEALIRTYRHVGRLRRPDAFRTWLFRTVRNACLMKRRRRVDEPAHLVAIEGETGGSARAGRGALDVADDGRGPDEIAMNAWLGRRLRQALAAIPPTYRAVVLLREIEGLSTREVARVLDISEPNVKMRLHRARAMLRAHLEKA